MIQTINTENDLLEIMIKVIGYFGGSYKKNIYL